MTQYVIYTDTAPDSQPHFGSGSHTRIQLVGDEGATDFVELDTHNRDDFEPGATNDFSLNLPEVGDLLHVQVRVDGSDEHFWHLAQIRVEKVEQGQVVQSWSASNMDDPSNGVWFDPQQGWDHVLEVC